MSRYIFGCVRLARTLPTAQVVPTLGVLLAPLLTGCAVPSLSLFSDPNLPLSRQSQATVQDMVDHVACELAAAYDLHDKADAREHRLWQNLLRANFVAAVDLTLTVTNTQGFNPSVGFVTPDYPLGGTITPIVGTGSSATSATYNTTLSVGAQANGSQDRNIDETYFVDMHSLVDQYEDADPKKSGHQASANDTSPSFPHCHPRRADAKQPNPLPFPRQITAPLQGYLHLEETIEDGLSSIDKSGRYNRYGASGPTTLPVIAGEEAPSRNRPYVAEVLRKTTPAPATPPTSPTYVGSGVVGKTIFSSKIDFNLTTGVNGGPNITLLTLKVGAVGGAPGGQILNFTRATQRFARHCVRGNLSILAPRRNADQDHSAAAAV